MFFENPRGGDYPFSRGYLAVYGGRLTYARYPKLIIELVLRAVGMFAPKLVVNLDLTVVLEVLVIEQQRSFLRFLRPRYIIEVATNDRGYRFGVEDGGVWQAAPDNALAASTLT